MIEKIMVSQVDKMTSFIVMDVLDKAKELESKGINVIHLEVGEPDFEPSQIVVDLLKKHLMTKRLIIHIHLEI